VLAIKQHVRQSSSCSACKRGVVVVVDVGLRLAFSIWPISNGNDMTCAAATSEVMTCGGIEICILFYYYYIVVIIRTVDVSASKLKDCMRQFTLSRKLQVTLDSSLINWTATTVASHDDQVTASLHFVSVSQLTLRQLATTV